MSRRVVCFHLLNDFSGSPRIMRMAIDAFRERGVEVDLFTTDGPGFLSEADARWHEIAYRHHGKAKWATLISFAFSQLSMFRAAWRYRDEEVVFWINTLLPFGPAIAGRFLKRPVVYHVHETSLRPRALKVVLKAVARMCATTTIFPSNFLMREEGNGMRDPVLLYNPISENVRRSGLKTNTGEGQRSVLMLCSLRDYKGVPEFLALAHRCGDLDAAFDLVLNASHAEIEVYFRGREVPQNVRIYPSARNVEVFYQKAAVVLNLSRPDHWVETFGLTLAEAMAFGVPVIAPPVGGPAELIRDGVEGFLIDSRCPEILERALRRLWADSNLRRTMGNAGRERIGQFAEEEFRKAVARIVNA